MSIRILAIAALLALSTAGAQAGPAGARAPAPNDDPDPPFWIPPLKTIIANANSCAPNQAEAAWGAQNQLLGYACVSASANGD